MGLIVGGIFVAFCLVVVASFCVVRMCNQDESDIREKEQSFDDIQAPVDIEQTAMEAVLQTPKKAVKLTKQ